MLEQYYKIKSADLCDRCRYGAACQWGEEKCDACVRNGEDHCRCADVWTGTPCPWFEEAK